MSVVNQSTSPIPIISKLPGLDNLTQTGLIVIGVSLIILGIFAMSCYYFTKKRMKNYKSEQLKQYKIKYNRIDIKYDETGMFLPLGERIILLLPIFIGLVLFIIGIAWLTGSTLSTM
ncbi:MAG: hypothetical protein K4H23_00160 [Mollicutes bacterium PWAP]|nr:hypothetical protein [Mollicutes bacterium PWAP]